MNKDRELWMDDDYILNSSDFKINTNEMNEEYNLMKDASISEKELDELREIFKREYAKKKGWDPNNLTPEQLNEICSDDRWKGNFLIKS
jgi:HKD family nuclease